MWKKKLIKSTCGDDWGHDKQFHYVFDTYNYFHQVSQSRVDWVPNVNEGRIHITKDVEVAHLENQE